MENSQKIYDNFEWQEFIVGDLFTVESNPDIPKSSMKQGIIPHISASGLNNGVDGYIEVPNKNKTFNNAISIVRVGEPGISFYHPYTFTCSGNVRVLILKNKVLTPNIGIFLCTCLEKLKDKYSYGKTLSSERLNVEKIILPIKNGELDFEGMEDYIEKLREEIVPEIAEIDLTKTEMSLDESEWGEFSVEDLFYFITNKQLEKRNYIDGDIPFVTATTFNNGVSTYIGNDMNVVNNAITITIDGECGITFYHSYDFIPGSSTVALKLKDKEYNKWTAVFLCTCLEKLKVKYSYGLKLQKSRLKTEKIWLPTKGGSVNYDFMERYIKGLNFSEILG